MEDAKGFQGCSSGKHLLLHQHQHQHSCENGKQGDELAPQRGNTRDLDRTLSMDHPGTQALKSSSSLVCLGVLSLPPFRERHTCPGPIVGIAVCFDAVSSSSPSALMHLWFFPFSFRFRELELWRHPHFTGDACSPILSLIPPSSTML